MNIIQAMDSRKVFRHLFKNPETWKSWRVFLKALFNIPMSNDELSLFKRCTGISEAPAQRISEAWILCGRRSGKSFIAALLAVFLAIFKDWSKFLSPGERAYIFIVSVTKFQAGTVKDYLSGILNSSDMLRRTIKKERTQEIDLENNITISCQACNYRGLRGKTVLVAICEEICFWRWEAEAANQDLEVIRALQPSLGSIPESLLISISSPYVAQGVMADKVKKHHGNPGPILCWKSDTRTMNPNYSDKIIAQAYKEDPEAASAEYGGEWRKDISTFLDPEIVEAARIPRRYELRRDENIKYFAFLDPSGGRADSFTLAIAHRNEKTRKIVLDVIREARPPFKPDSIVKEYAEILKNYGIHSAPSDHYAGEWVTSAFKDYGIEVEPATKTKSEYYLELLPLMNNGSVELLDRKRLLDQLKALQRKTRPSGNDLVDNFFGHDDIANVAAGVCVSIHLEGGAQEEGRIAYFHGMDSPPVEEKKEELGIDMGEVFYSGIPQSRKQVPKEKMEKEIEKEVIKAAKERCEQYGYVTPFGISHSLSLHIELCKNILVKSPKFAEDMKNRFILKRDED